MACSLKTHVLSGDFWLYDRMIDSLREKDFKRLKDIVYLDHSGAALYSELQLRRYYEDLAKNLYGNPHSGNPSSTLSADYVDQIRERVLHFFNTNNDEYSVIFTSGATQSLKILAECFDFNHRTQNSLQEQNLDDFNLVDCKENACGKNENNDLNRYKTQRGYLYYSDDNHTSVVGMRGVLSTRNCHIKCFSSKRIHNLDVSISKECMCTRKTHEHEQLIPCTICSLNENELAMPCLNSLFVYPAQSNYCGRKYSLNMISLLRNNSCYCHGEIFSVLDAASFVSTSHLDLGLYNADFVIISFYKMFGFPTGLGALLVRKKNANMLKKVYFGGGTVSASVSTENFHVFKDNISDRFEDGTVDFLSIVGLKYGFDYISESLVSMEYISRHTFELAQFVYSHLSSFRHGNNAPVAIIYADTEYDDRNTQGPIINFNIVKSDGSYVGYSQVDKLAQAVNIHLRTGCFCNMGACQVHLGLSTKTIKENLKAGHVCGDDMDLVNGKPTGSVRISFGSVSSLNDATQFLGFIIDCFIEGDHTLYQNRLNEVEQHMIDAHSQPLKTGVQKNTSQKNLSLNNIEHILSSISDMEVDNKPIKKPIRHKYRVNVPVHIPQLTKMFVYPVKSCGAFEVTDWKIGERGLEYDREWMIVTDSGLCLSQKRETRLCTIKPNIDLNTKRLTLSHKDMCDIHIPLNLSMENKVQTSICTTKLCKDRVGGIDCGDAVAEWLSSVLQTDGLRLVRHIPREISTKKNKADLTAFRPSSMSLANEAQYLLINTRSVEAIYDHMKSKQALPLVSMEELVMRFRANIVVDGFMPFEEESWNSITVGHHRFENEGPCSRCQMICVDQTSGEKSREPLLSILTYRNKKMNFGVLFRSVGCGPSRSIRVGDAVTVKPDSLSDHCKEQRTPHINIFPEIFKKSTQTEQAPISENNVSHCKISLIQLKSSVVVETEL